jgi:uncharacterized protein YdaU (DUF1376 family)
MADKLLAEWFWTDRWMGSSGFLLPMLARGVYREMLTQAWRRGARLPNDPASIKRAIGATDAEWAEAWPAVSRYWRVDDTNHLVNDTQLSVYAESKESADNTHERAMKGAQARWKQSPSNAQASAQAKPEECPPSPSPSPSLISDSGTVSDSKKIKTVALRAPDQSLFEHFWLAYPKKVGKGAALKAWVKLKPSQTMLDSMIAAVRQQIEWPQWRKENGQFIPHPATWLNQGRWQDEGSKPINGSSSPQLLSEQGKQNLANSQAAIAMIRGRR